MLASDNLQGILEYLPISDHSNFVLVSKQFHTVFYASSYGRHRLSLLEVINHLATLNDEQKLEYLHYMRTKIRLIDSKTQAEVITLNLYARMLSKFKASVIEFKDFLQNLKIVNIHSDVDQSSPHRIEMDYNGTPILLRHEEGYDYFRVDIGSNNYSISYTQSRTSRDSLDIRDDHLTVLPSRHSSAKWFKVFYMLGELLFKSKKFTEWKNITHLLQRIYNQYYEDTDDESWDQFYEMVPWF
jgi:hypothetical protein